MMLYDKKFYKYIGCCAVYFVFTICYLFFSNATTVWQASWFSDKFFVYQYAIVLLLGYSIISSYYNSQTYNRFETRKRIVTNQLFLYALLNLILVTMLFVLAMAVTMILGGAKSFFTLQTLLDLYFRFLLGSYLLETIDLIFEYSGVKSLSAGAQIISFLLLNFELSFGRVWSVSSRNGLPTSQLISSTLLGHGAGNGRPLQFCGGGQCVSVDRAEPWHYILAESA